MEPGPSRLLQREQDARVATVQRLAAEAGLSVKVATVGAQSRPNEVRHVIAEFNRANDVHGVFVSVSGAAAGPA